jgi:hypothetical protein
MCIVPSAPTAAQPRSVLTPAHTLSPKERQHLALDALSGQPITALAQEQHVSRKFVYQQLHKAHDGSCSKALGRGWDGAGAHANRLGRWWSPLAFAPWALVGR